MSGSDPLITLVMLLVGLAAVLVPILLFLLWKSSRSTGEQLVELNRRLGQVAQLPEETTVNLEPATEVAEPAGGIFLTDSAAEDVAEPAEATDLFDTTVAEDQAETTEDQGFDLGELDEEADEAAAESSREEPEEDNDFAIDEETEEGEFGSFDLDFSPEEEPPAAEEEGHKQEADEPATAVEVPEESESEQFDGFDLDLSPAEESTAAETGEFQLGDDEPAAEEATEEDWSFAAEADDQPLEDAPSNWDAKEENDPFAAAPAAAAETDSWEQAAEDDPFASAPAAEEPAEQEEPPAAPQEQAIEEPAATAVEEEEQPAIIKLPDDPKRDSVSMARCGNCDHKLAYKKSLAGKRARCPACKSAFVLP